MTESDKLCDVCARVDLYSLFTGYRWRPNSGDDQLKVALGTLEEVRANAYCPLCRLVRYQVCGLEDERTSSRSRVWHTLDPARTRCFMQPMRVDYDDDGKYIAEETKDLLASMIQVHLEGAEGCSRKEVEMCQQWYCGHGFRLLSPGSVDPKRPLLNGYHATTVRASLDLLAGWISACDAHHGNTCSVDMDGSPSTSNGSSESGLDLPRVVDAESRKLLEVEPEAARYAALSYVWGSQRRNYASLLTELEVKVDERGHTSIALPAQAPTIIEDAVSACKALSIPYLWVDLYCIHQEEPERKAAEIRQMGYVYRRAYVTVVAGSSGDRLFENGFEAEQDCHAAARPPNNRAERWSEQMIVTIDGKEYISSLLGIKNQIRFSRWSTRGWTFQEGQMSRRIAFFGDYDISFLCGAGHWRESQHSGCFGHDAGDLGNALDLHSTNFHILSARQWLSTTKWRFREYLKIIQEYSARSLSFESDRLDAISGCLSLLTQAKGTRFLNGLPSTDFHYALLWRKGRAGQINRPSNDFPSWSWAGWERTETGVYFDLIPEEGCISASLVALENGCLAYEGSEPSEIDLRSGFIYRMTSRWSARCSERLARLFVSSNAALLTIESEVAKFSVRIKAANHTTRSTERAKEFVSRETPSQVPQDIDTTHGQPMAGFGLDPSTDYITPYKRLDLEANQYRAVDWEDEHALDNPAFMFQWPCSLPGVILQSLQRDGLELVRVLEISLVNNSALDAPRSHEHVLCLGIDRKGAGIPAGRAHRLGWFGMPKARID